MRSYASALSLVLQPRHRRQIMGLSVRTGLALLPARTIKPLEEQRSEKYRYALIAVVSIGVRAGQLGGTDAWLSSHLVSHA